MLHALFPSTTTAAMRWTHQDAADQTAAYVTIRNNNSPWYTNN